MMHYGIDCKLNKEKSHAIKEYNPYRMIALANIIKLFINRLILIPKHAPQPILHILARIEHGVHVVVIFPEKWTVRHVGFLGHFYEGEEAD